MGDIKLTYETLYEVVRLEKARPELQELSPSFFEDALAYLREKKKIVDETKFKTDIFSSAEREKTLTQIRNIKKLLNELYEKRESKILAMALNKSRTDAHIVDTSNLLPEEKKLYQYLLNDLNLFREGVLFNLLEMNKSVVLTDKEKKAYKDLADIEEKAKKIEKQEITKETEYKKAEANEKTTEDANTDENKKIKFLTSVDKFFGKELEPYGPFNANDITDLPNEIADVLINNGQAVLI